VTRVLVPGTLLTLISIVYLFGVAPDMTWMGLAGDSPDYVASSLLFQKGGLGGYPLYISIGWAFEQVFHYGLGWNPYFSLGLLSALCTVVTCGFIYATIRLYSVESKLPACLGVLAFASSLLVWSQSVVPEVYSITVMLMVIGTYYLLRAYQNNNSKLLYLVVFVFGLSFCTHPLAYFAILLGIIYIVRVPLDNKPGLIPLLVVFSLGLIPWAQWIVADTNESYPGLSTDKLAWVLGSAGYVGNLSILPSDALIIRLKDFISVIGLSVCILVPSYVFGLKTLIKEKKPSTLLLVGLISLPLLLYVTSRPPQWITYMLPSLAFISILGGICSIHFLNTYKVKSSLVVASVCGLGLLGMNFWFYDIGRSIDPSPSTARQMYNNIATLPEDSIVFTHSWGHVGLLVDTYNRYNGSPFIRIDDTAPLKDLEAQVKGTGIVLPYKDPPLYKEPLAYLNAEVDTYLKELVAINPGRDIYVIYLKDRTKVQFDLISASSYRHSLNDVPQLSEITSGRIRVR